MNIALDYKKRASDRKSQYRRNIEKAFLITLAFFLALVLGRPRFALEVSKGLKPGIQITVENIPATRQFRRPPPPPRPTIPVPSDDPTIPEDLTIEETTLKYTSYDEIPEGPTSSGARFVPPRPIAWVFPEYPEEERKRGVQGLVRLSLHIDETGRVIEAIVIENTTGSEKCAQAAIAAALGSRFSPAREGSRPVSHWITQPYRFDIKKK